MSEFNPDLTKKLYGDILHLPHFTSKHHERMPLERRAAEFGAFAALTGHYEALAERARHTEGFEKLERDRLKELDNTLSLIKQRLNKPLTINLMYFQPDERKEGGEFIKESRQVVKFDETSKSIHLENGKVVGLDYIISLQIIE